MLKHHFTRKNFISIGCVFFFCLMVLICALMIDGKNPVFAKNNPVQVMAANMFPYFFNDKGNKVTPNGSLQAYILTILFSIYVLLCYTSILYEVRLAKYYNEKPTSRKWLLIYIATFFLCGGLWIGISLVSQMPLSQYLATSFAFLGEAIAIGALLYLVLAAFIVNLCFIVVNIKNIDKPFKMFDNSKEEEKEALKEKEEEKKAIEQGQLAASFGEGVGTVSASASGSNAVSNGKDEASASPLKEKERVFPGLCSIDYENEALEEKEFDDSLTLEGLSTSFRNYLAKEEGLYFSLNVIREFLSGLAASRILILEGLSGTGKSSLARYFSSFISEKSYFEAVQATWRDRTSILGYYNDFSNTYNETEFLKRLYDFSYKKDDINIMVLDELNISRIEYYFADFLSVLEYPMEDWKIKIMQFPYDFEPPLHLQDGVLQIPENTYFIGTANKDESTFTITDKVYDRAITIDFDERNEPFEVKEDVEKVKLSYSHLQKLYSDAVSKTENQLSKEEYLKFKVLTDYTYEMFDLTFGNRILRQIQIFVPVFVACGGSKLEALDFLFSQKVVRKLEGRFEDYIKQGLLDLKTLIVKTYGENTFVETNHNIDRLLRKL